ncbi:hypothetical protein FACS189487_01300 [Campylobacterota bacterium]|nr:hypothetical protein FACS189487_01300 [Campylobacterota bacterium]
MLYGVPGTGKTEMAKTLAKNIKADLIMLSEKSSNSERGDRLDEYCVVKAMLGEDKNTILLMDEAEDVFYGSDSESKFANSKLFINRMLETNKIPVIWISNSIGSMDRAYLRRFSYALEVPKPDENAKCKIWHNILSEHKMNIEPKRVKQYAKQFDIAPALIDTAVRTATLSNSPEMIEKTIESLQKAMIGYVPLPKNEQIYKFDPALSNAAQDLEQIAANLAAKGKHNFSMCLYGAPGTGKSAFARYLAGKLKMKVIQKRSSDLQSPFLGVCERNIANAFREAKSKKAMLIIDEADSFLQDRSNAQRSWEVSQVGEMLSQMECHPYPFVCTTNLMDSLDRAALRRFTMKIQYHYLTPDQVVLACKRLLRLNVSLDDVKGLDALAPGDFKVVLEQSKILDIRNKPELLSLLREEIKVKEPERKTRVGFGA